LIIVDNFILFYLEKKKIKIRLNKQSRKETKMEKNIFLVLTIVLQIGFTFCVSLSFNETIEINSNTTNINKSSSNETESLKLKQETFIRERILQDTPAIVDIKLINLVQLIEMVTKNPTLVVIDTRNSNEYNGWKPFQITKSFHENNTAIFNNNNNNNIKNNKNKNLQNKGVFSLYDIKNAHVADAHNLDADWLDIFDESVLNTLIEDRIGLKIKPQYARLTEKNTTLNNKQNTTQLVGHVVLYDTNIERLEKAKNFLVKNFQIEKMYVCQIGDREMTQMLEVQKGDLVFQEPFFDMLISVTVLNVILSYNAKQSKSVINYKLFDISIGNTQNHYQKSHIPTAIHMNLNDFESQPFGTHKNRSDLGRVLLNYGILPGNREMIILYGNPSPGPAFRIAVMLKWMGVRDVHVLNGGFTAWKLSSMPTDQIENKQQTLDLDANNIEMNVKLFVEQSLVANTPINYIVDEPYVGDIVKNIELFSDHYTLVDIRSYEEHMGEKSAGIINQKLGRIPGSLWGRAGGLKMQLDDYRNIDMTMRSGAEILKMWDELSIDYKHKHLIFYCSDGLRSAEVMFYAELMGLYKISLYDGGWREWSSNPKNLIESGPNSETDVVVYELELESSMTPMIKETRPPPINKKETTTTKQTVQSTTVQFNIDNALYYEVPDVNRTVAKFTSTAISKVTSSSSSSSFQSSSSRPGKTQKSTVNNAYLSTRHQQAGSNNGYLEAKNSSTQSTRLINNKFLISILIFIFSNFHF
jgi:molybdopterin synthase sulfurtransferase